MAAGIAVDYGYDKLMAYADIEEAKASFSAYLQENDADLNKEQADILAGAAIKFAKEAGRVLTHKYASKGVKVLKDKLRGLEQQPLVFYKEYTSGGNEGVGKESLSLGSSTKSIKKWLQNAGNLEREVLIQNIEAAGFKLVSNPKAPLQVFMRGEMKIRLDPPKGKTPYNHMHLEYKDKSYNLSLNPVDRTSSEAHIPIK